jgi:CheY-like chemotaxis protein
LTRAVPSVRPRTPHPRASDARSGLPSRKVTAIASRPRLVVVDDSPEFLALVRDLVADRASVECFDSPDTLVDDVARVAPDMIMIDLKLDGAGRGWDLLRECRADPRLAGLTFVICSADVYGIEEHQPEISSMTDVHVLRKPFDIAEFEDAIAPVLDRMTAA